MCPFFQIFSTTLLLPPFFDFAPHIFLPNFVPQFHQSNCLCINDFLPKFLSFPYIENNLNFLMASETEEFSESSSVIERLINSRNRDLALFLPFILAMTNSPNTPNPVQDSSTPDQEAQQSPPNMRESTDRIILINPLTQGMVVIEGSRGSGSSSSSLESLLRDLFSKDGQPPASKASIEAMPMVEVKEDSEECVICLEEWEAGALAKEMPCKHRFHGECIEKWLRIHGSCPVCRHKMPVEENDDKSLKNGDAGGTRREIWVSFAYSNSNLDRRSEEINQGGSNDSGDSSQTID
ncbi:E3 ubiquitin-protein ligase MPSR1-like [Coffea arabica]|uniref:RING-type E3 ubiquitin transferase n=1 Tax=Coffea arabica TaxID=13443 RepID=A0ABM4W4I8_COFAR|nr:E3 ubiquitin-protein ligase MPSR1 [Coffea arabica]